MHFFTFLKEKFFSLRDDPTGGGRRPKSSFFTVCGTSCGFLFPALSGRKTFSRSKMDKSEEKKNANTENASFLGFFVRWFIGIGGEVGWGGVAESEVFCGECRESRDDVGYRVLGVDVICGCQYAVNGCSKVVVPPRQLLLCKGGARDCVSST